MPMILVVYREFAEIWNQSNSVAEVCQVTGHSKSAAATLACKMRRLGWQMKHMSTAPTRQIADRFWEKVLKGNKCWTWTGSVNRKGYGQISQGRRGLRPLQTHRLSWEMHNGAIPTGMLVLHRCDNPSCIRPDHLFLGTAKDNTQDMINKKRAHWQKKARRKKNENA